MQIPEYAEHLDALYEYGMKLMDALEQEMETSRISEERLEQELSEEKNRNREFKNRLSELLEELYC